MLDKRIVERVSTNCASRILIDTLPPSLLPFLAPFTNQSQQRRIQELERINIDLERRLEQQARERMKLERESVENKRAWEAQHTNIGHVRFWRLGRQEERKGSSEWVYELISTLFI